MFLPLFCKDNCDNETKKNDQLQNHYKQYCSSQTRCDRSVIHQGVFCNACQHPIIGPRYVCTICDDYDLCDECEATNVAHHPANHLFLKAYCCLPPRNQWPKFDFTRIYPNGLTKSQERKRLEHMPSVDFASLETPKRPPCEIRVREMEWRDIDDVMVIERESFATPYERTFFEKSLSNSHIFVLVAERTVQEQKQQSTMNTSVDRNYGKLNLLAPSIRSKSRKYFKFVLPNQRIFPSLCFLFESFGRIHRILDKKQRVASCQYCGCERQSSNGRGLSFSELCC